MKYKFILTSAIIFLFLLFSSLFLIKVNLAENPFIHHSQKTYPLSHDLKAAQTFIASRNNLTALELRFKNINDADHQVGIYFREGGYIQKNIPQSLVSGKFSSRLIENDKFYRFYLPLITDSLGKEFTFFLGGETASHSASVSPIISDIDIYLDGNAYINDQKQKGDLIFKPVYEVSLVRFMAFYLNRIAFAKPAIFGKIPLFFIVFSLAGGFLILFFLLLKQTILISKDKKEFFKVIFIFLLIFVSTLILFYSPKKTFSLMGGNDGK